MRPAPPRGAVLLQPPLSWAEFHDGRLLGVVAVLHIPPKPSVCPTRAAKASPPSGMPASGGIPAEVQSRQVLPAARVPSALEPVRTSCSFGVGEPVHWPLIRLECSSMNTRGSPLRACRLARSAATITPRALNQGPLPMRSLALVGMLLLAGSFSTLR